MNSPSGKLLAVDPSLTQTGWALFCLEQNRPIACGIVAPPGPKTNLQERLHMMQLYVVWLFQELNLSSNDILICEGPAPLVLNPQSALKVERVRGVFESVARLRNVLLPGRINPRTVQSEILGMRGKQLPRALVKESTKQVALQLFRKELTNIPAFECKRKEPEHLPQDIFDALLLGNYASSKIILSRNSGQDLYEAFQEKGKLSRDVRGGRFVGWTEESLKRHRAP